MNVTSKLISSMISKIDALYISGSFCEMMNKQSCDCDEIIMVSGDKRVLFTYEAIDEDARITFKEIASFDETAYPYEVMLDGVQFSIDQFTFLENGMIEGIRFAAEGIYLFVFASNHNLVLTMSKYDLFGENDMDFPQEEAMLTIADRSTAGIFCDEPIIAVYEGQRVYDDLFGADAFLDCYCDLAYHVTEGYRIILETESFYISLSANGITKELKYRTMEDFQRAGEWIEPFAHHQDDNDRIGVEYPFTLFVGERLLNVEKAEGQHILRFDDFLFKVIPHELNENDFPSLHIGSQGSYNHVLGAERHITATCSCGGEGELLLDFVSDYVVRCKKCKKSTSAQIFACEAIEEWNEGHIQCDLSDITIGSYGIAYEK